MKTSSLLAFGLVMYFLGLVGGWYNTLSGFYENGWLFIPGILVIAFLVALFVEFFEFEL
jgi:hypothetical protein